MALFTHRKLESLGAPEDKAEVPNNPLEAQGLELACVYFVPRWNTINSWEHAQLGNTMFWLIFYFHLSHRRTATDDP